MQLNINISLDNAAFSEGANQEVARILSGLVNDLEWAAEVTYGDIFRLTDANGNRVGEAEVL